MQENKMPPLLLTAELTKGALPFASWSALCFGLCCFFRVSSTWCVFLAEIWGGEGAMGTSVISVQGFVEKTAKFTQSLSFLGSSVMFLS